VRAAQELLERAKAEGASLVGPGGLLTGVTKTVLQSALEQTVGTLTPDNAVVVLAP